jgi:hypothetical protein
MIELVAIAKVVWKKARPATFFRARLTEKYRFYRSYNVHNEPRVQACCSMLEEGSPNATSRYDGSVIWLRIEPHQSCQLI